MWASPEEIDAFRASLLAWFDTNRRALPWRGDSAPFQGKTSAPVTAVPAYHTWVSEIMLQQTRVQTALDYFRRWLVAFPTVQHVASASLEEVNAVWAGLGYYRRAKMLKQGCEQVVAQHEGKLPLTKAELLEVPGIGPYTAGAIASIAGGEAVPAVDGNVIRVMSRVTAVAQDAANTKALKLYWYLAGQLVPNDRPGDFNQVCGSVCVW